MYTIGILESGPTLSGFLSACMPRLEGVRLLPSNQWAKEPDLLVVSPDLQEPYMAPASCRALLVPGRLAPMAADISADWAVSYGNSPKDSLTLSSLGERDICLALQREVVTLRGERLDQQEFLLPRAGHTSPHHVLACAGIQLLLGIPPEQVEVGPKQ